MWDGQEKAVAATATKVVLPAQVDSRVRDRKPGWEEWRVLSIVVGEIDEDEA